MNDTPGQLITSNIGPHAVVATDDPINQSVLWIVDDNDLLIIIASAKHRFLILHGDRIGWIRKKFVRSVP